MLEPSSSFLLVANLTKRFGDRIALDDLSFTISRGEIVCLLGPNGAGKTTTMKLLLGLLRPSSGRAEILGIDCTHEPEKVKARIGFTEDEPTFYDFLSGRETLDFVLQVRGQDTTETRAFADEVVQMLGFGEDFASPTGRYSLGMRKKLALLLAVAHRPDVLLLDEPTNGLDPQTAIRTREFLKSYARSGHAVLVSTHLLDMVEKLADRLLIIRNGRLVASGTVADIRASAGESLSLEEAFVRLMGGA